jgi:hypothetical protein|tara:strand:- start:83 stop:280 length:198 start_codon:yes stop_codon:yes gene_type:complete
MTTYEKEQLIGEMYRLLNRHYTALRKQYLSQDITLEEMDRHNFPIGAIDMLTKLIREFEINYEAA